MIEHGFRHQHPTQICASDSLIPLDLLSGKEAVHLDYDLDQQMWPELLSGVSTKIIPKRKFFAAS